MAIREYRSRTTVGTVDLATVIIHGEDGHVTSHYGDLVWALDYARTWFDRPVDSRLVEVALAGDVVATFRRMAA